MKFNGLHNLAIGKTARQSSTDKGHSLDDASNALIDDGKWAFAFHTNVEDNPWWQVDLGAVYPIYYIVIGNRRNVAQERAITLTIETSLDGQTWQLIHTGLISWDDDLVWPLNGQVSACFVRLSLREKIWLHLANVEVWGIQDGDVKPKLESNNSLWTETLPKGLEEIQAFLTAQANQVEIIFDLGDLYPIWAFELLVPSEIDFESIKYLKIETSSDGYKWWIIHEGMLFWRGRLYYPLQGEIMACFIKISRPKTERKFCWPIVKVFTRRQLALQVWALRHDGLGNRLMALLQAVYIAKLLGCDYKFVWPKRIHRPGIANSTLCLDGAREVFCADFIHEHMLDNEQPDNTSKLHHHHNLCRRHFTRTDKQDKPGIIYSTFSAAVDFYHPRLKPPDSYFKSLFESLSFSSTFREVIEMAHQVKLPPNFAAIHLRSGDIIFSEGRHAVLRWQDKVAPVSLAKLALEKLRKENIPVVIFGRDPEALTYLADLHQASLATDYLHTHDIASSQQDLFEMILMSRASYIYACLDSLYAHCAGLIGGNVKRIDLHELASPEEKTAYLRADLEQNASCYHPFQNSFSYLYLYHLNHLTADQDDVTFYLNQAQTYDPENEVTNILRATEYFKNHNEKAGEELLENWLKLTFDLTLQTIRYTPNRFFDNPQGHHLAFHMKNYLKPLESAAKQGYPNAAAVMHIMYDFLKNQEQALFWRGIALGAKAAHQGMIS